MIRIKVCKLSDLMNRAVLILISWCIIVLCYKMFRKLVNPFSLELIQFSIQKTLCLESKPLFLEKMITVSLPLSIPNVQDDIEKEFYLVDNLNSNGKSESSKIDLGIEDKDKEENTNSEQIELKDGVIDMGNNDRLATAYLLDCEKISDSKYKIGDVTINDYTRKKLDFNELEKSLFTEVEEDCKVLIYHTHTSESYSGVTSDATQYHTENNQANVVRVGEELKTQLNKYGILVRQDMLQHDYPSYNGAYKSSLNSVENILKNENYDIIIDIHRDALASNAQYRPTAEINGDTVAKLMFVVGTNAAGLKHDNWIENLKFAIAFQQRANELFPGLFRDIHLSTSRYNQHTSNKSLILEVGATGNTIEEACLSMKYFAKVLDVMRK